ncbi:hypothetical protein MK280_10635, partial [Myxococcota bacterium]|nr:hypothetical protein [Myxococcota bacterium]
FAERGFSALRFDFSGIGDSPVRRDDLAFEESAVLEIQESMDSLGAASGAKTFVLIGLCSGADMAFKTAQVDARVVGLGLLDPWVYRTPRYYWKRYGSRLLSASAWSSSIRSRFESNRAVEEFPTAGGAENGEEFDLPTYVRDFPPRRQAEVDLRRLMERDIKLCCVFSGGQSEHYNYEGQFCDAFRRTATKARLTEIFQPAADHIFTDLGEQRKLLQSLLSWTTEEFHPEFISTDPVPLSEARQAG